MSQSAKPKPYENPKDSDASPLPKPAARKSSIGTSIRACKGAAGAKAIPPTPAWVQAVRKCAEDVRTSLYERFAAFPHQDVEGLRSVLDFIDKLSKIEGALSSGAYYSATHVERCARGVYQWSESIRARYPLGKASSKLMIARLRSLRDAINSNNAIAIAQAHRQEEKAPQAAGATT